MSLYKEDKEEVIELIKEYKVDEKEETKQIIVCAITIIMFFIMLFGTIVICNKEGTKRKQIEKFGEQISITKEDG